MTKEELKKIFHDVTGICIDLDTMIENASDNNDLFRRLCWMIPAGSSMSGDTPNGEKIREMIQTFVSELGVDPQESFEEDGFVSDRQNSIFSI